MCLSVCLCVVCVLSVCLPVCCLPAGLVCVETTQQVDANATLYNSFLRWKALDQQLQPAFEDLVAHGLERVFCRVCDATARSRTAA